MQDEMTLKPEPKGPPPPPKHDVPPHILHEIMDLKEKVGKLEGMMEMLIHERNKHCECGHEEK